MSDILTDEVVEKMQAAVEGECGGLAIDKATAKAVLSHVLPHIGEACANQLENRAAVMLAAIERLEDEDKQRARLAAGVLMVENRWLRR